MQNEIWYRRGSHEKITKKKREPHRIPGKIMLALERWERLFPNQEYLVEHTRRPSSTEGKISCSAQSLPLWYKSTTPRSASHNRIL